jgi:hypothetical protein
MKDGVVTDEETDTSLCDQEAVADGISDQALERACGCSATAVSTLIISSYSFTCGTALRLLFSD